MSDTKSDFTIKSHFDGKALNVRHTYDRLVEVLSGFGPITEEAKKTSIHIVNATALAGVATRKSHLILTVKSDRRLESPRIHKSEQTSAKRFHHEIKLASPGDIDQELIGWLKDAYSLSGK
jgi:hypothetical protein